MNIKELSHVKSQIEQLISLYNEWVGEVWFKLELSTKSI